MFLHLAGEDTERFFKQSFHLKIKGDLIPEAAVEPLQAEMQVLFARNGANAALTAKAKRRAEEAKSPPLQTYPTRLIQGGRLELAPPKRGVWFAEPKVNGWRALVPHAVGNDVEPPWESVDHRSLLS